MNAAPKRGGLERLSFEQLEERVERLTYHIGRFPKDTQARADRDDVVREMQQRLRAGAQ